MRSKKLETVPGAGTLPVWGPGGEAPRAAGGKVRKGIGMSELGNFDALTPEVIFDAAEEALNCRFSGVLMPLPSYINRVYEMESRDRQRYIFKFYRPGRWSRAALLEEHLFTLECLAAEIPVIAPLRLASGSTLGTAADGTFYAVFPKRWGRALEADGDSDVWFRLGSLLGRVHTVGAKRPARHRLRLDPRETTVSEVARLLTCGVASQAVLPQLTAVLKELLRLLFAEFHADEVIRLHGDCHKGNILERPGEGLMVIDFDDMVSGPPVQDLWLLLPGPVEECGGELERLLAGYQLIREFDRSGLRQIELLRAMRMIYFLDWCARQRHDYNFQERYPNWGTDAFWRSETAALAEQLGRIARYDPCFGRT